MQTYPEGRSKYVQTKIWYMYRKIEFSELDRYTLNISKLLGEVLQQLNHALQCNGYTIRKRKLGEAVGPKIQHRWII